MPLEGMSGVGTKRTCRRGRPMSVVGVTTEVGFQGLSDIDPSGSVAVHALITFGGTARCSIWSANLKSFNPRAVRKGACR